MAIFYYPNCTLPSTSVSYVGSPNFRTTLDILWSSLATIIACTYTVLHLNLPEQRRGRNPGFKGDLKWGTRRLLISIKWTITNILAPEVVLAKSLGDFMVARRELKELHKKFPHTRKTWSMAHMLFADMGGFVLQYEQREETETELRRISPPPSLHDAPGESGTSPLEADEASSPANQTENKEPYLNRSHLWHLDAYTLRSAIDEELLTTDIVAEEEISDKSKSDFFSKAITMIQITYFVIGVFVRAGEHLTISQLELGVVAFVACSVVTYGFSISKPKGVCTTITIKEYTTEKLPLRFKELQSDADRDTLISDASLSGVDGLPFSNDSYRNDETFDTLAGAMLMSIPFGAIHLAGWDFQFPTLIDLWLWRAAALVSTSSGLLAAAISLAVPALDEAVKSESVKQVIHNVAVTVGRTILLLYTLARLVLIVEMFRCLFFATPDTFASTWTVNIPHIG